MRLIGLVILTSSLTLASAAGEAQPSTTIPRIGLLADSTSREPLRLGLRDLGYVEGKSFALEERSSQGRNERFSASRVRARSAQREHHRDLEHARNSRGQAGDADDPHRHGQGWRSGEERPRLEPRAPRWKRHGLDGTWPGPGGKTA